MVVLVQHSNKSSLSNERKSSNMNGDDDTNASDNSQSKNSEKQDETLITMIRSMTTSCCASKSSNGNNKNTDQESNDKKKHNPYYNRHRTCYNSNSKNNICNSPSLPNATVGNNGFDDEEQQYAIAAAMATVNNDYYSSHRQRIDTDFSSGNESNGSDINNTIATATTSTPIILRAGDVRCCSICGLIKKKSDFPLSFRPRGRRRLSSSSFTRSSTNKNKSKSAAAPPSSVSASTLAIPPSGRLGNGKCRVCIFLTARGLAYVHCVHCQEYKPTIAFTSSELKKTSQNEQRTCRVCYNEFCYSSGGDTDHPFC